MSDRFSIDLGQLPAIVRSLGDRGRDAQSAADKARSIASLVDGLNVPGASSAVSDAQRSLRNAQAGFMDLQKELGTRAVELAQAEGNAQLTAALLDAMKPPAHHSFWDSLLNDVHSLLDVVGMVPLAGDLANGLNGVIYLGQGDLKDAAISGLGLIPIGGGMAIAVRVASKGAEALKEMRAAEKAVQAVKPFLRFAANGVARTAAGARELFRDPAKAWDSAIANELDEANRAFERAQEAQNSLPATRELSGKTVASDGAPTISGWAEPKPNGFGGASPTAVQQKSIQIGHDLTPAGGRDQLNNGGFPGKYNASHAEKQQSLLHPGEPVGVTRPVCTDCQAYFQKLAEAEHTRYVVTDPDETWIFNPDGTVERIPRQ